MRRNKETSSNARQSKRNDHDGTVVSTHHLPEPPPATQNATTNRVEYDKAACYTMCCELTGKQRLVVGRGHRFASDIRTMDRSFDIIVMISCDFARHANVACHASRHVLRSTSCVRLLSCAEACTTATLIINTDETGIRGIDIYYLCSLVSVHLDKWYLITLGLALHPGVTMPGPRQPQQKAKSRTSHLSVCSFSTFSPLHRSSRLSSTSLSYHHKLTQRCFIVYLHFLLISMDVVFAPSSSFSSPCFSTVTQLSPYADQM